MLTQYSQTFWEGDAGIVDFGECDVVQPDALHRRIGHRIRQARQERGMSLAKLGGDAMSRGFLSSVEHGRSSLSLESLATIAARLKLPVSYFLDEAPALDQATTSVAVDHAQAALGYSLYLRALGKTEEALEYALWAAQARTGEAP
jgi:transcriptional regulator with XRE-family HTH domain